MQESFLLPFSATWSRPLPAPGGPAIPQNPAQAYAIKPAAVAHAIAIGAPVPGPGDLCNICGKPAAPGNHLDARCNNEHTNNDCGRCSTCHDAVYGPPQNAQTGAGNNVVCDGGQKIN